MTGPLTVRFPPPPRWVRHALTQLDEAEEAGLDLGAAAALNRPWDPATCSASVRAELWPWLDDVAGWINHCYAWQTAQAIPPCWPAHPHLVTELAVLACLRVAAADATTPDALEDWHRYALPGFGTRMAERLGLGCPPGRHVEWPARSWWQAYTGPEAAAARRAMFDDDLSTPPDAARTTASPALGGDRP
jgi:hypothetical protein